MFAYVALALLVIGASADHHHDHGDHPRLTCGDITPLSEVDYNALGGNWVAVESVAFKDGHPWAPANPDEDRRPKTCMYLKDSDISETGMKVKIDFHYPGEETKVEAATLTKTGDIKGRLTYSSVSSDRDNWEFLVLEADPAKYMVYVLCQPPNEAGERLPLRVNLLSRHADHSDHEVITNDEELEIEKRVGDKLHLAGSGVKAVKYSHDCWASYAEPQ